MKNCIYLIIILLSLPTTVANSFGQTYEPLVIGIPEYKPYTYQHNGLITGSAIAQSAPIFTALDANVTLKHYPNYSLLLKALKKGAIQGFFLATQNLERDRYAKFSLPLTFNNWSWFSLKQKSHDYESADFKNNATIAAIEKTNTFRWLTRNGYQVHSTSISQLVSLILDEKVDAILSAESVFIQACNDREINISGTFNTQISSKHPFGMYISKRYLERNAGFMDQLNELISETNQ